MLRGTTAVIAIVCGGLIVGGVGGKVATPPSTAPAAPLATRPAATPEPMAGSQSVFPWPMDNLYENRLQVESSEYLSANLFNVPIDPAWAEDAAHYTIVSADDDRYARAKAVHPTQAGSRTRAVRVAVREDLLVKQTAVFLHLPTPMRNGCSYAVTFTASGAPIPALPAVACDDARQINDNIRLNQLGYLPGYEHHAYIGQYMGTLGGMPVSSKTFELWDERGKSVYSGAISPRGTRDDLVGQIVYDLDFSSFPGQGTFQVHVSGVGMSYPFEIGPGAINPLYLSYLRGHYHQRCGMAIDAAFSRHSRPACHLDDACLDQDVEKLKFVAPKHPPLYPTHYDGKVHPAIHGHHDAGDYGKYTSTGATYVFSALDAMAVFPDKFQEDDLGLPYSGNGIPDLVEEVKWELDWLENMQDEDGGVFGVILPNTGGYENSMPAPLARRWLFPKDTVFTAAYAGALAEASRSAVMRKYYPGDCGRYRAKALKAWDFLEKNNNYVEYFHYGATFGDWDERCWAAAELYAATGADKYHKYFLENFDPSRKQWTWKPLVECVGYAVDTYVFMKDRPRDAEMLKRCQAALHDACKTLVADSAAYPYRLSVPQAVISSGQYGWMFPGDFAGYDLLMGYAMEKNPAYLQCALDNLSYTCGANPSGYFLMTGIGWKRNIEAVSNQSSSDNIIEPVPGLPLGIGTPGIYWLGQYGKKAGEGEHPAKWPLMNRWYDGFNVQTEFTMGPMMRETIVAGYFADVGKRAHARPTVKIVADPATGTAPLAIHFSIQAGAPAGGVREVFWDFGDESFSTSASPAHVFPGATREYPVAVTVLDEDGRSAYDTAVIRCSSATAPYPRTAAQADAKTVALFHLDGDLKDSSGHGLALAPAAPPVADRAPWHFAERPPLWMKEPAGSCLVLDGAEQFAATLPRAVFPGPATRAWKLEMKVYIDDFAGWGFPGNPVVLGVRNDSNSIGWRQETWDRGMAPKFFDVVPAAKFAAEFPRRQWAEVAIEYDGKGTASFFVNGQAWGSKQGCGFRENESKPTVLTVGPFKGMVDEVRLTEE
jgi:hypothetical protein